MKVGGHMNKGSLFLIVSVFLVVVFTSFIILPMWTQGQKSDSPRVVITDLDEWSVKYDFFFSPYRDFDKKIKEEAIDTLDNVKAPVGRWYIKICDFSRSRPLTTEETKLRRKFIERMQKSLEKPNEYFKAYQLLSPDVSKDDADLFSAFKEIEAKMIEGVMRDHDDYDGWRCVYRVTVRCNLEAKLPNYISSIILERTF